MVTNKKRKDTDAGVVLKIHVENFMCHRKLTVPFCRHVNFINGRNGSGKSAILAALQICLGAKAYLTHRAKKMTDFIRHGWQGDAVLEVTLLNDKYGFKFDEYGSSITVRRTIRQPNGSTFELLSHDKKVKSRDRAELLRMLEELNVQVDNPCSLLDQENSKKFLQGSEHDKYAFFMRATDLDRILSKIDETKTSIEKMKADIPRAEEHIKRLSSVVEERKAEVQKFKALEDLENGIRSLEEKLAWAFVSASEADVAKVGQQLREEKATIETLNERRIELKADLARSDTQKGEIKSRFDAAVADTARLKGEMLKATENYKAAKQPMEVLTAQRSTLLTEEREKIAVRNAASKKLKAAREAAKRNAINEEETALLDKIQQAENSLANAVEVRRQRGGEEKVFGLRQSLSQVKDGAKKAKEEYEDARKDLATRHQELRSLATGASNPLIALGKFMPALVKRIRQAARQFTSPPVGPLGACIQLKEECKGFQVCIEGHLQKNLKNFVVACHEDKTKLMALMKRFRGKKYFPLPTIIVQARQSRYRPPQNPPGILQIMQAINVADDQAFNALVDQSSIEKICLFASKEEAEGQCLRGQSGNYQRMPHGMFEAYYPSLGGKSCSKFSVNDGNVQTRMNTVNPGVHRRVLGVDEGTQRQDAMARVEHAAARLERAKAIADTEVGKENAAQAAVDQEEAERDELVKEQSRLEREKTVLSTELLALQATKSNAIDPTEEATRELEVAVEGLGDVEKELAAVHGRVNEALITINPFKVAKETAVKEHKDSGDAAEKIQDELDSASRGEAETSRKLNKADALLAKHNKELDEVLERKRAADEKLEEDVKKANVCMANLRSAQKKDWDGERVPVTDSVQKLRAKVDLKKSKLHRDRRKENLGNKTYNQVRDELQEAVQARKSNKELCDRLQANEALLTKETERREKKWNKFRRFVSRDTTELFGKYLQTKGSAGEVRFDHDKKVLGLTYQRDGGNDRNQCTDVRLLSGGERSYATLALLLALGTCHDCPFRAMDEFDVFMDAASRNVAIKSMLEFAEEWPNKQFIFITPQDLSSVTSSKTCCIFRLQPPRKGDHTQTTLEESFGAGAS
ncbi:unnamed protein product [Scytosiphon promiscuus]